MQDLETLEHRNVRVTVFNGSQYIAFCSSIPKPATNRRENMMKEGSDVVFNTENPINKNDAQL